MFANMFIKHVNKIRYSILGWEYKALKYKQFKHYHITHQISKSHLHNIIA